MLLFRATNGLGAFKLFLVVCLVLIFALVLLVPNLLLTSFSFNCLSVDLGSIVEAVLAAMSSKSIDAGFDLSGSSLFFEPMLVSLSVF